MPLVHRRAILETKILDQWIEQGELHIRYAVTWDDGIVDTWEGRISILNKQRVASKRLTAAEHG